MIKYIRGFTLIELMVTVTVITALSAIMLANYNTGGASFQVENNTRELMSLFRKAEAYANASKKFNGQLPGGYGVSVNAGSAPVLFADLNSDRRYNSVGGEAVETLSLDPLLSISQVVPAGPLDIFYEPPKRDIYFNGVASSGGSAAITVNDAAHAINRTLTVSTYGQLSITQ